MPCPTLGVAFGFLSFFKKRVVYQTEAEPLDVATGDINGDGFADVLTANRSGFSISVFISNGDGTLTKINSVKTQMGFTSLTLADMDGDKLLDIVASTCTMGCTESKIYTFHGNGDGSFVESGEFRVKGVAYNVTTADFNSDGFLDIAASDYPNKRLIVLMSNEANGAFKEVNLPAGKKTIAVEVGDLDNDGIPDLVSSNHGSGNSTIYLSDGTGGFSEPMTLETGKLPYSITLADLNLDKNLDLIVAQSNKKGTLKTFLGKGDGTFEFADEINAQARLVFVKTSDINNDGRPDLFTAHDKEPHVTIYLTEADGKINNPPLFLPSENKIYSIDLAHLDEDEYIDLVTVDFKANTLSVALGRPASELEEHL